METREERSFCRICWGFCGVVVTIDGQGRVVKTRGDKSNPMSEGYACIKGLQSEHAYYGPQRLLHSLKRQQDGSYSPIPLEKALDEIAAKLAEIVERDGPEAVSLYKGGMAYNLPVASTLMTSFLSALGTNSLFTPNTIDQSAKAVSADRLGSWLAGKNYFAIADTMMIFGGNPILAVSMLGFNSYNPTKKLRDFKARGGKLIVIDPRRTETARLADVFLQPRPGEDLTIAAGMLRMILAEKWEDREFCANYASQLEELRKAVDPFTPEYVEKRADIPADLLRQATECFAKSKRGFVMTSTGTNMAPRSNVTQHLIDSLDVLCGHFLRAGDRVANPGLVKPRPWRAEVVPPGRCWEKGPKSRVRGLGLLFGEKMSGAMAQEITTPGPGQIKAMIVHGGNPATSVCDQKRIVEALKSLELLVSIDPQMTTTPRLSHYVLAPKLQFEHANVVGLFEYETLFHQQPSQQYSPKLIDPPPGSDLVDDWYVYWAISKRLGLKLMYDGVEMNMDQRPDEDELLALLFRNGPISLDDLKRYPSGHIFDIEKFVEPGSPENLARFEVAPLDVVDEVAEALAEDFTCKPHSGDGKVFDLLLISRRLREVHNSSLRSSPAVKNRQPFNSAYVNPEELQSRGLVSGDRVVITSDNGAVPAIVEPDPDLRAGVISMAHGWGSLPEENVPYEIDGACTGLLVSTERDYEKINAMPRQSAIPVYVERAPATLGSADLS